MSTTGPPSTGVDLAIADVQQQFALMFDGIRASLRDQAVRLHPRLQPLGYKVVVQLARSGPLHVGEVAERLGTDKSLLSRTVKQLEQLELVARQPDPDDGRACFLVATDDAVHRLDRVRAHDQELLYQRMHSWDPADVLRLADLLQKLNQTFPG